MIEAAIESILSAMTADELRCCFRGNVDSESGRCQWQNELSLQRKMSRHLGDRTEDGHLKLIIELKDKLNLGAM